MKKVFKALIIALSIFVFSPVQSFALTMPDSIKQQAQAMELDAASAILIDAATGEILYEKNKDQKEYPASITKLMTMLLAFENCEMDEVITFSHDAVFSIEPGSSHIGIDEGEEITVDQAMYAIMLQSANEVSNGVAEHIDGSMEAFAEHMTQRAHELGATNTNFVNANGLHNENHYTTAYDMSLIARELLKYPHFKEILSSTYYEIPPTNIQSETRYLHGQTQLIKSASIFYYENCEGGKTGFTDEAGNTLVAYAKNDNIEVISVVLKSTGYGEYYDTIKLFDFGLLNFADHSICSASTQCGSVEAVTEGVISDEPQMVQCAYESDITAALPIGYSLNDIESKIELPDTVQTPVNKGDVLGSAVYTLNGEEIGRTNIVALNSVNQDTSAIAQPEKKNPINIKLAIIIILILLIILFIVHCIIVKIRYERRRRRRRERLKRYRETNYQDIQLSAKSKKYR